MTLRSARNTATQKTNETTPTAMPAPDAIPRLHMARDALLLSTVLLGCVLLSAIQAPGDDDPARRAIAVGWLTGHVVLLAGGCLLHARWRVTQEPAMGWLATAFLVPSMQLVPLALLSTDVPPPAWTTGVALPIDLVSAVPVLTLVLLATRKAHFPAFMNPVGLAATIAVPCLALAGAVAFLAPPPPAAAAHAMTAVAMVVASVATSGLTWLRALHRGFLALGAAGLLVAHDFYNVTSVSGPADDALELMATGVGVVSSVVIVVLTLGLFRRALDLRARRLAEYQTRAEEAEEWRRREEELMHEVRATMAGISTATYVLNGRIPMQRQMPEQHLRTMLDTEVARVQRLLCQSGTVKPGRIELDEILLPQVVAQQALGHDVRWERSGVAAYGRADKLAEAVHVVLTNAARHSSGGPVHVQATQWGGTANITITDSGPGVAQDMRGILFERGTHGEGSPGLGVGLYLAQTAVQEDGGSIRLQDPQPDRAGATFVISLRAERRDEP